MKLAISAPILAAMALSSVTAPVMAASPEAPIRAGYWESRNKVSFPINDESTSRQCITAEKVAQFLTGPSTKNFQCTYSQSQVANGAINARGRCVDKNGIQSTVDVKGSYTPTQFKLDAKLTVNLGGLPIPVNASTDATFLSETCPTEPR